MVSTRRIEGQEPGKEPRQPQKGKLGKRSVDVLHSEGRKIGAPHQNSPISFRAQQLKANTKGALESIRGGKPPKSVSAKPKKS